MHIGFLIYIIIIIYTCIKKKFKFFNLIFLIFKELNYLINNDNIIFIVFVNSTTKYLLFRFCFKNALHKGFIAKKTNKTKLYKQYFDRIFATIIYKADTNVNNGVFMLYR